MVSIKDYKMYMAEAVSIDKEHLTLESDPWKTLAELQNQLSPDLITIVQDTECLVEQLMEEYSKAIEFTFTRLQNGQNIDLRFFLSRQTDDFGIQLLGSTGDVDLGNYKRVTGIARISSIAILETMRDTIKRQGLKVSRQNLEQQGINTRDPLKADYHVSFYPLGAPETLSQGRGSPKKFVTPNSFGFNKGAFTSSFHPQVEFRANPINETKALLDLIKSGPLTPNTTF